MNSYLRLPLTGHRFSTFASLDAFSIEPRGRQTAEDYNLRVARQKRIYFDDGIGELAHSTHKSNHQVGIELRIRATLHLSQRFFRRSALFVAAIAGDGVIGISDGNDPGSE